MTHTLALTLTLVLTLALTLSLILTQSPYQPLPYPTPPSAHTAGQGRSMLLAVCRNTPQPTHLTALIDDCACVLGYGCGYGLVYVCMDVLVCVYTCACVYRDVNENLNANMHGHMIKYGSRVTYRGPSAFVRCDT